MNRFDRPLLNTYYKELEDNIKTIVRSASPWEACLDTLSELFIHSDSKDRLTVTHEFMTDYEIGGE